MKYATSAALSLALSLGLAAAAQAQGVQPTSPPNPPPAGSQMQEMQPGAASEAAAPTAQQLSPSAIMEAQRSLKSAGLYQGRIDGIAGPQTHQAVAAFQQQHNLEPTGQLSAETLARLTGGTGVGSTMPSAGTGAAPGQPMPGPAAEPQPAPTGGNGAPTAPGAPPPR